MKNSIPRFPASQPDAPLLPGIKPVLELLESEPHRVDTLFLRKGLRSRETARMLDLCRAASIRFSLVEEVALDHMCVAQSPAQHHPQHQGVVARLAATSQISLEALLEAVPTAPLPVLLALDQVQDPGNVGTLARTLYALGGAGLLLPRHNSAYLGGAARRSAAGALERLPVACVTNLGHALDQAEEAGLTVMGAGTGPGSVDALREPLPLPVVLVLGNEGKGLRPGVAKRCALMARIPMARDFDSLNVAQAGAILLSCLARQAALMPIP